MKFATDLEFNIGLFHIKIGTVDVFPPGTKVYCWNKLPSGLNGYLEIGFLAWKIGFGITKTKSGLVGLVNAKIGIGFIA